MPDPGAHATRIRQVFGHVVPVLGRRRGFGRRPVDQQDRERLISCLLKVGAYEALRELKAI
jgi:hypothetical protein